jgi:hypothetical protein
MGPTSWLLTHYGELYKEGGVVLLIDGAQGRNQRGILGCDERPLFRIVGRSEGNVFVTGRLRLRNYWIAKEPSRQQGLSFNLQFIHRKRIGRELRKQVDSQITFILIIRNNLLGQVARIILFHIGFLLAI